VGRLEPLPSAAPRAAHPLGRTPRRAVAAGIPLGLRADAEALALEVLERSTPAASPLASPSPADRGQQALAERRPHTSRSRSSGDRAGCARPASAGSSPRSPCPAASTTPRRTSSWLADANGGGPFPVLACPRKARETETGNALARSARPSWSGDSPVPLGFHDRMPQHITVIFGPAGGVGIADPDQQLELRQLGGCLRRRGHRHRTAAPGGSAPRSR
jgi:hypothetical protein